MWVAGDVRTRGIASDADAVGLCWLGVGVYVCCGGFGVFVFYLWFCGRVFFIEIEVLKDCLSRET